ncbi:MAG: flagellin [Methanomicrobiales archaeon]|nr:flagellin [Methanomicrobiales archaeon]
MAKLYKNNKAFTGLEAALVLIAFTVVAAVFSYVVLDSGFYTTQKSQQVIQVAIAQVSGNTVVKGEIYGIANHDTTTIEKIKFAIGPAVLGTPVDYSRMSITWSTSKVLPTRLEFTGSPPVAGQWSIIDGSSGQGQNGLVNDNQIVTILACPPYPVSKNERFTLAVLPESGASISISRTIPMEISEANLLF